MTTELAEALLIERLAEAHRNLLAAVPHLKYLLSRNMFPSSCGDAIVAVDKQIGVALGILELKLVMAGGKTNGASYGNV